MVTRMMRWPWPTGSSKKFTATLMIRGIERFLVDKDPGEELRMRAEVRWKGKIRALSSLGSVKRNCTRDEMVIEDRGDLQWNEEFESVAVLTANKENSFNPWAIEIAVFTDKKKGTKKKTSIYGTASLNLAEYASSSSSPGELLELNLPLLMCGNNAESLHPILHLSLKLLELSATACAQQPETIPSTSPSSFGDKEEPHSAPESGFRKVFRTFVRGGKSRKTIADVEGSEEKCSVRSEEFCFAYGFDTESIDDDGTNEELDYCKDDATIRKSISYGSLADANFLGVAIYNAIRINDDHENWIYYSHKRSDGLSSHFKTSPSIPEKSPKRRIFPWRKRKYSFRSPKAKGEPLLKKAYGEVGGDDIDYDRRLLTSPDESLSGNKTDGSTQHSVISEFGDDSFAVGSWESREIISRCGNMKLAAEVFFASIDQRSERAAGESACTALVAVMADWFQSNPDIMPVKSQFDGLIREGSLEWRNLCENQTYRERFPDKHFDLETVLGARIRPLSVAPEKSFVGFFHPEGCEDGNGFGFLDGAMSFDGIWEEIGRAAAPESLFIVSWNDHFFVLKVERGAYYIIDTLGERLYEGCNQAYILKFDETTSIHKIPSKKENNANEKKRGECASPAPAEEREGEELICQGKESCKEYIKNFLAAIPIRELQADIKMGMAASSAPLHRRLQIEFHYAESDPCTFPPLPQSAGSTITLIPWLANASPEALYRS
ncbi:hypothetical protein KSP39_PZI009074 [Platanthera zijinensis]|uniref:C2 NT-type domain-containing protein n=1 Tax=Platanthera zijinensis TaxID=2320716 RepID=A0AAP0BL29_9ASPA